MSVPVPQVEIARKGTRALTGDIYTRRWTTEKTVGKGKKKRKVVIEHEARVNPVSLAILAVAGAGAGLLALGGLWMAQMRVGPKDGKRTFVTVDIVKNGEKWRMITRNGIHVSEKAYDARPTDAQILSQSNALMLKVKPYGWISTGGMTWVKAEPTRLTGKLHYGTPNGKTYGLESREGFGIGGGSIIEIKK